MLLLPLIVLLPFAAAFVSLLAKDKLAHDISMIASALVLILTAVAIIFAKIYTIGAIAFSLPYISSLGIGLDFQFTSLSLILTLMTAIVFFAASLVGKYFIKSSRLYNLVFLMAEGASMGVFLASNLFLFFAFWEIAEIMMFFIIFAYGGYERRYAAIKFIIYSIMSSLLLLIAIMILYTNAHTFSIETIISGASAIPMQAQFIVMALLLIAFMIKMPVFPFHTWLPDAHTEAPTTGSMVLAGVLLKFGGYGLLLMFLMVPLSHTYALYMALLFGFSAVYSALVTFRQANLKRLIAYTSITDMGIIAVGIAASNALGTSGAIYAMLAHALAISLLFLIAGSLDEVYGTLEWGKIRGVIANFPGLTYLFVIGVFATVGLPLTAGFIGDILVFLGAFDTFQLIGIVPLAGVFLIGAVLFWIAERVFLNQTNKTEPYEELSSSVLYAGIFLVACTIVFGALPFLLTSVAGI